MTTAHFRSTSNDVPVTNKDTVREIINEYELPYEVDNILQGDTISIQTPDMPNYGFHVEKITEEEHIHDATDELYERIAEYLTKPLKVNTVQTHGVGNSNITITVHPDGEIKREDHTPRV